MVKRALMIAFHFPPVVGSSGVQRVLHFGNHLVEHGWRPAVLTVKPLAYRKTHPELLEKISPDVDVIRTLALDAGRHLSIGGSYPGFLGRPDPWANWVLSAVPAGLSYVRRHRPKVIWSTYPFATAHVIASILHRLTKLPWVADCRDMMVEDEYPEEPELRRRFLSIERDMAHRASKVVVTTPGTLEILKSRYADVPGDRWQLIRNGFDEETFASIGARASSPSPAGRITLLHSGILYPSERDPTKFFEAIATLKRRGAVSAARLRVVLRATGHDEHHGKLIADSGIQDIVSLAPGVPYSEAIDEMLGADGLLLFQASNCNHQVPAKLYEYFRSGRPVLALTDPAGDTAATLREAGVGTIARLDDSADIVAHLERFLDAVEAGDAVGTDPAMAARYSRRSQAAELARLFDSLGSADPGR